VTPPAFHHLFIHVRDLARTRRFYERLGMQVQVEEPGYLRLGGEGGFAIGFEERAPSDVGAAGIEIDILVRDVDDLAGQLREAGVPVTAPSDQAWGARHAWFHDPDGYRLSIYSELPS
jgi:catechol 2,3-dioxygenase-like lactoylglutathione lyase family enzyme